LFIFSLGEEVGLEKRSSFTKEKALEYLQRNNMLFAGMISPIQRGTVEFIYAGCDGVFIKETESSVYMLAMDSLDKGMGLLNEVGRQTHICFYQKALADYFYEKYSYKKYAVNVQAVYSKTEHAQSNSYTLEVLPLTFAHMDWVQEHLDHLGYDYLKERLGFGAIYGGYIDGEICGSVGIHAEGSIGMLHVLEMFRKRGFASELVAYITNILIDRGEIPFSQIEFDNKASTDLHKKMGYKVSTEKIFRLID